MRVKQVSNNQEVYKEHVSHERVELYLYSPYGPYGPYRASVPVQGCTLPTLYKGHNNSGIFVPVCLIVSARNIRLMEKVMKCKFYCFVQF